jgi:Acetyltransferase (GNAT) domain
LFELNSDPEVMRFLNGGMPTPRDEVRTKIIPVFLGHYERFEGLGFWAAAETATGQFLGWFHFRPPLKDADTPAGWDEDGVAELGYRLRGPHGERATRPRGPVP